MPDWVIPLLTLTAMEIVLGVDNIIVLTIMVSKPNGKGSTRNPIHNPNHSTCRARNSQEPENAVSLSVALSSRLSGL